MSTINITIDGIQCTGEAGQTVDQWIKVADDKLYFGKKNGKNRVIVDLEQ